jgi:hypothetical protein
MEFYAFEFFIERKHVQRVELIDEL